jgi:hypothetical protein
MAEDLFYGDWNNDEDGIAWISVFCKGGTDEMAEKFRHVVCQKYYEDREEDFEVPPNGLPLTTPQKIVFTFSGGLHDDIYTFAKEAAQELSSLQWLIVNVWGDVEDDGTAGYDYVEFNDGKQTSLIGKERLEIGDFGEDEAVIIARNKGVKEKLVPVVEKWLKNS